MLPSLIRERAEAKADGLKRYFTGRPCKRGHVVERLTVDGACLECHRLKMARYNPGGTPAAQLKWRKANPEKVKALRAASYARNKTVQNEQSRAWGIANAQRIYELNKVRRLADPIPSRAYVATRKARKRAADGSYSTVDVEWLRQKQKGRCAHSWCPSALGNSFHVDHIMPLARGGGNGRRNLQLLCKPCNMAKQAIHPIDFAQRHGMLL